MEILKPMRESGSLMKMTGSSIMDMRKASVATIDYNILNESRPIKRDPYASISIADMTKTDAKAQFDGICVHYPVPDTRNKTYKIHGQIDYSLNKKPKSTFLSEIIDNAKSEKGKRPGPGEY